MRVPVVLNAYLGRQFLFWFLSSLLALVAVIMLVELIELFRRTSSHEQATVATVVGMALLKLPHLAEKAAPFAVLFGAMLAFWKLNRNLELIVVRAAGVSVWQFLLPVVTCAFAVGVIKVALFNPFAAAMLLRYEHLEAQFIKGKSSLAAVSGEGIWLRQATERGHYVLHAQRVNTPDMVLSGVIVFLMQDRDTFVGRIDAKQARLADGYWAMETATVTGPGGPPRVLKGYKLDTDLTRENINDSFAPPETLSFWALPKFIAVLEAAGFSGLRHRLSWHTQLADPALLCAMVVLAATFSLRHVRRGGTGMMVAGGIAAGFLLFFLSDVVSAFGASAKIPIVLAAWSPTLVSALIGTAVLFHFEDG